MGRYGEICNGCGGEDCQCCSVWIENQADQRAAMYEDAYFYEEYGDYPDGFDYDDEDDDWDSDEWPDEREYDTPLGDLYGSCFED